MIYSLPAMIFTITIAGFPEKRKFFRVGPEAAMIGIKRFFADKGRHG